MRLAAIKILILVLLLVTSSAVGTTYVVFRYDDFAPDKPGVRFTDVEQMKIWEAEKVVDNLFDKYGVPYVIGVIPRKNGISLAEDNEKSLFIKRAVQTGRVEAALHGYSHTNHAKISHRPGEFRERNYVSQLEDIKQGKEILCEVLELSSVTTFIPPWYSWDKNTAKALKETGFSILSADSHYWYDTAEGLTIIPYTAQLWELEAILSQDSLPNDYVAIILYHPPQIAKLRGLEDRYFGVSRLDKLLQKLSELPDVKVVTFEQLTNECEDLSISRYRAANNLSHQRSFWTKLLPTRLLPGAAQQSLYYLSTEEYSQILWFWKSVTLVFVAGILAVGLLVRYFLGRRLSAKWRFRINVLAALLFCLSVIAELRLIQRGYHITGIRLVPGLLAGGFLFASLLSTLLKTRPWSISGQGYKIR